MKTKIFLFASFFLLIGNLLMAQNFDFRNVKWGADSTQIAKSETGKMAASPNNSMQLKGKLGDWDARIIYYLGSNNQLWHATYMVRPEDTNPQTFVNTFLLIQSSLTSKYKEPYSKVSTTINGKVITQDEWASNLISDNLNLETKWKNDRTNVILSLFSINDQLILEINYYSIAAEKKMAEDKKQDLIKDL